MTLIKINKKKLWEHHLMVVLADENYEAAAIIRDELTKISNDEVIEVDDGHKKIENDDN